MKEMEHGREWGYGKYAPAHNIAGFVAVRIASPTTPKGRTTLIKLQAISGLSVAHAGQSSDETKERKSTVAAHSVGSLKRNLHSTPSFTSA